MRRRCNVRALYVHKSEWEHDSERKKWAASIPSFCFFCQRWHLSTVLSEHMLNYFMIAFGLNISTFDHVTHSFQGLHMRWSPFTARYRHWKEELQRLLLTRVATPLVTAKYSTLAVWVHCTKPYQNLCFNATVMAASLRRWFSRGKQISAFLHFGNMLNTAISPALFFAAAIYSL